ncbi:MAG: hypothetical protein ACI9LF_002066, partial [Flavobacteriales bacterium]
MELCDPYSKVKPRNRFREKIFNQFCYLELKS